MRPLKSFNVHLLVFMESNGSLWVLLGPFSSFSVLIGPYSFFLRSYEF